MKKALLSLALLLVIGVGFVLKTSLAPSVTSASVTLADTINSVLSSIQFSNCDAQTISVGTLFDKLPDTAFDSASVTNPYEWALVRQIALEDGYNSSFLDNQVKNMMKNQEMVGSLPVTDTPATDSYNTVGGVWSVNDRYLISCYDLASQWGLTVWNETSALGQLQADIDYETPLSGFGTPASSLRY